MSPHKSACVYDSLYFMWMYNRLSGEVKPNCLKYRVFGNYASVVSEMYGPPSDCKGKVLRGGKVCVNVSGLWVEICSPGLDEIRRVPVLRNPSGGV